DAATPSLSEWFIWLAYLHRLCHGIYLQPVVLDLLDLMPGEARRILDGLLERRRDVTVGDDIEPIALSTIFGDAPLVWREQNVAGGGADPLHLDQPELARSQVEAGHVIAEVLLVDIEDLPAKASLVLHDDSHGNSLGLQVLAQP